MITAQALKAALIDRNWLFCLPASTPEEKLNQNSILNSLMVSILNEHFKVPTCHSALIDAEGNINPGFFIWDPKPATVEKIRLSNPLITLTPKELYIKDKPLVYPDSSTLHVTLTNNKDIIALGLEQKVRESTKEAEKSPFYVNGRWQNCFFLIPNPFPSGQIMMEKVQTLANIRSIDLEEVWPILHQEAHFQKFTPRTERVRRLFLEVAVNYCPAAAEFGYYYNDAEGNRV